MARGRASSPRGALEAALEIGQRAARFVADRTEQGYLSDDVLKTATERLLIQFGEALNDVPRSILEEIDPVMDWSKPIGFRHVAAHWYVDDLDHQLIWVTVTQRLPAVLATIDRYLKLTYPP